MVLIFNVKCLSPAPLATGSFISKTSKHSVSLSQSRAEVDRGLGGVRSEDDIPHNKERKPSEKMLDHVPTALQS